MSVHEYVTVDIGGTKIRSIAYTAQEQIEDITEISTNSFNTGKNQFFTEVLYWVQSLYKKPIEKMGIAINSPVHNNEVIYSSLGGGSVTLDFKQYAEHICNVQHVVIENDVFALAKGIQSIDPHNYRDFTLVNLGTGIRLANVINGSLQKGFTSNAGEISQKHIYVKELDRTFKIDNFLSGKGFTNMYYHLTGHTKTAKEICTLSDKDARLAFSIFSEYFIHFMYDISYFYNPQYIILSSSLSESLHSLCKTINERVYKAEFSFLMPKKVEIRNEDYFVNRGLLYLLTE